MKSLILIALLFFIVFLVAGCSQVEITKTKDLTHLKINTLFKDIDFDLLKYKDLVELKRYESRSKDVKTLTPYGVLETEMPNE